MIKLDERKGVAQKDIGHVEKGKYKTISTSKGTTAYVQAYRSLKIKLVSTSINRSQRVIAEKVINSVVQLYWRSRRWSS